MEIIYNNTNTIYSKFKIKKTIFDLSLSLLVIIALGFLIYFMVHLLTKLDINDSLYSFYYSSIITLIVLLIVISVLGLALVIFLIITIIKHINVLKYYKEARFTYKQTINFEFDYKLWQTAKKHSFHSQVLRIKLDDDLIERKSRVIFTNHERIGVFRIPLILQSHTYKKEIFSGL